MKKIVLILLLLMLWGNYVCAAIITEIQVTDDIDQEDIMGEEDVLTEPEPAAELEKMDLAELTVLAEKNDAVALLALGDRYYYGKGGAARDRAQAFKWYLKAAELDCVASQFNLGHMYRNGTGTKQDMLKSLEWFERAADLGDAESQFMAAEMHSGVAGVPKNNVRAYLWYKIAYTTMEPRFRGIAKAELDLLKQGMTKEEVAEAEALVLKWHEAQLDRLHKAQQN